MTTTTTDPDTTALLAPFVERCRAAVHSAEPRRAVITEVAGLMADPDLLASLPVPAPDAGHRITGADETIFEDDSLTVMLVHTRPGHDQPAHDHLVDAIIGVYDGGEVHRFYRRTGTSEPAIEHSGTRTIRAGDDVLALTPEAVHAIAAADGAWTRAVHVYLGGLSGVDRSIFHPETGVEEPLSMGRYVAWCRPNGD